MKKKNSNLGHEDDNNRFNRVLQRLRHHDQPHNKESPARKPNKSHRPTMPIGSHSSSSSLAHLFSKEAKENRPPELMESLAEKNKKKKKNIWKWRPMKSLGSHSSGDRAPLPCIFSVYVDSIHELPSVMSGTQCFVKLHRKNGDDNSNVQTRTCRIINGTVDIDETLQIHSSVICTSRSKHECSIWVSVYGVEMGATALSTHCLDLSRLLPQASGVACSSSWATTVKLTGKAKGALLVATFACQLVRDDGRGSRNGVGLSRVCNTPQSKVHLSTSPAVSELDLDDVPSLELLSLEEQASLAPAVEDPTNDCEDQKHVFCDAGNNWVVSKTQAERPCEVPGCLGHCGTHFAATYYIPSQQSSLNNLNTRDDGNVPICEDNDMMLGVVDQGVEVDFSVFEQRLEMGILSTGEGLEEQEINPSEKMQKDVDYEWWQGRGDTYRGFREHMELIEEELARLEARIDANDCWSEKLPVDGICNEEDDLKEKLPGDEDHLGRLAENPPIHERCIAENITKSSLCVNGSCKSEDGLYVNDICIIEDNSKRKQPLERIWESLEEDEEKLQETLINEIQGFTVGKQMANCSSDEDTDSVTNEFLNLLERGQIASDITLRKDLSSPCKLLQGEYEQQFPLQNTCSSGNELDKEMQSSFMDIPELEIQKAEQALLSKARARILEDAEAQALMQTWGLNENVFELSPPKSNCLSPYSNLMENLISSPPLEQGMGSVVQTRGGGYIRSMNPGHFENSKIGGKLVMHVSKPVVMSTEMGSTAMDILRRMAAIGMDNLASQAMMAMPLEDITGKTIQEISLERSSVLEGAFHEEDGVSPSGSRFSSEKSGSHLNLFNSDNTPMTNRVKSSFAKEGSKSAGRSVELKSTEDSTGGYVSAEDLAPLAMQKIEALVLEGLRIQSNMADKDASFCVDPLPLVGSDYLDTKLGGIAEMDGVARMDMLAGKHTDRGMIQVEGAMANAISLQKWMQLNAGVSIEDERYKTNTIKVAHQDSLASNSKNDSRWTQNDSRSNCINETITIAMLVQLRDPLRNYEPVGAPMIALIQAERIIKPPRPKLSKQVSTRTNDDLEEDEDEEYKLVQVEPQFKITEVHVAGLKAPETDKKKGWFFQKWGSKKQEQSGSRWLIANGMGKNNKPALLKSKPLSSQSKTTVVKPGESLWSISSRVHGTGSKWQEIASLNPHIRNPDIIFPNQTIRTK